MAWAMLDQDVSGSAQPEERNSEERDTVRHDKERDMSEGPDVKIVKPSTPSRFRHLVVVGLVLSLVPWSAALAGESTEQLKGSVEQVIKVLEDRSLRDESQRRAAIRQAADRIFDFEETAKRALGQHWQRLSEKDRKEFVSLFADLLERAYISKIERYSGEKIVYAGENVEGDTATAKTRFVTTKGTEVPVDYRMHKKGDRWLVYDVNVEGVSLVANYRAQFNKIIQTSGFEGLIAKMKHSDQEFSAPGGGAKDKPPPRS